MQLDGRRGTGGGAYAATLALSYFYSRSRVALGVGFHLDCAVWTEWLANAASTTNVSHNFRNDGRITSYNVCYTKLLRHSN